MCCGQKRSIIKGSPNLSTRSGTSTSARDQAGHSHLPAVSSASHRNSPTLSNTGSQQQGSIVFAPGVRYRSGVTLRYLRSTPAHIIGPVTGRSYQFSAAHPVQVIDSRDASGLLSTGFFRRA